MLTKHQNESYIITILETLNLSFVNFLYSDPYIQAEYEPCIALFTMDNLEAQVPLCNDFMRPRWHGYVLYRALHSRSCYRALKAKLLCSEQIWIKQGKLSITRWDVLVIQVIDILLYQNKECAATEWILEHWESVLHNYFKEIHPLAIVRHWLAESPASDLQPGLQRYSNSLDLHMLPLCKV